MANYSIYQNNLLSLKNDYKNIVNQLINDIRLHNDNVSQLKEVSKILSSYMRILYCYNYLTYSYKFTFSVPDESDVTGNLSIDVVGKNGLTSIVSSTFINESLINIIDSVEYAFIWNPDYNFETIISGNVLYVYSTDVNLFYASNCNQITYTNITTTCDSLENDEDFEIDNNINSISLSSICGIINHFNKLINNNYSDYLPSYTSRTSTPSHSNVVTSSSVMSSSVSVVEGNQTIVLLSCYPSVVLSSSLYNVIGYVDDGSGTQGNVSITNKTINSFDVYSPIAGTFYFIIG